MIIGVPKEVKADEYRVGMTPAGVRTLSLAGHTVLVEKLAGDGSGLDDDAFAAEGAEIVDSPGEVWQRSQMVVKVKEPVEAEYHFLREQLIVYTFLHLAADRRLTEALLEKKVTAIAYETVEEADRSLPILIPMSEIAGRMAVQAGAWYLERPNGGSGILLGGVPGVPPGRVAVIGGGVAGINAAKMAVGLGARVTVLDISLGRLRHIDDIFGGRVETAHSNPHTLHEATAKADLLIGSVLVTGARAPHLVSRGMVGDMKKGSVIVDISVDQGGCVETSRPTSHREPVFSVDGVTHYCVSNMPGAVPHTSTFALTNANFPYAYAIAQKGFERAVAESEALRKGVNTWNGLLACAGVATSLDMQYTSLKI